MPNVSESLSTFAGPAGVGALCLLGIFLFLDGRSPSLFSSVEQYAKSSTWSVVAAIPVLAISYVLGLSIMIAAEHVIARFWGPAGRIEAIDLVKTATAGLPKESLVPAVYYDALRNRAVLAGGSIALLILAVGAVSEVGNLPILRGTIIVAALATVLLAVLVTALAVSEGHRAHSIADAVGKVPSKASSEKTAP